MSLYIQLGEELISKIVTEFYVKAFADPIIGHFFFHNDRESITQKQISFALRMLGGPSPFKGKPLLGLHKPLAIRPPHFGRRQVLMAQTCNELGLAKEFVDEWMRLEETLRPIIISY